MIYQIYCVNTECNSLKPLLASQAKSPRTEVAVADLSSRLFLEVWNLGSVHPVTPLLCLQCPIPEHCLMVTLACFPEPSWIFGHSSAFCLYSRPLSVPVIWPQPSVAGIFLSWLGSCYLLPLNPSVGPSCSEKATHVVCTAVLTCYPASTPINFLTGLPSPCENPHFL